MRAIIINTMSTRLIIQEKRRVWVVKTCTDLNTLMTSQNPGSELSPGNPGRLEIQPLGFQEMRDSHE